MGNQKTRRLCKCLLMFVYDRVDIDLWFCYSLFITNQGEALEESLLR